MIRTMKWLAALAVAAAFGPVAAQTVEYMHTDALGSVVAVTNSSGAVVERNQFEPYGEDLTGIKDGPGYTGHVSDAATGLSYMQQRYYDPQIGRFLSVDPVTAHDGNLRHFNRYDYAYNNPYKFTDPDGRQGEFVALRGFMVFVAADAATPDPSDAAAPGKAAVYASGIAGLAIGGGIMWAINKAVDATPEPAKSPEEAVNDAVTGIREGKGPAPGKAGERGELQGEPGGGDADWEALGNVPGAEANGPNNIKLPDGSNANRHSSTRPYADGPAQGTDTIKHYPANSSTPGTTIRYPEK